MSMIDFGFVPELLREARAVWDSVAARRDSQAGQRKAAVIGHLRRVSQIIGEFVEPASEEAFVRRNISLCAQLKAYAADLDAATRGAGLSAAQSASLKGALTAACDLWPPADAFHRAGQPLSAEARAALTVAMAEIDEFARMLSTDAGPRPA